MAKRSLGVTPEIAVPICKALRIDPNLVTRIQLTLDVNELPDVIVHMRPNPPDAEIVIRHFQFTEIEEVTDDKK